VHFFWEICNEEFSLNPIILTIPFCLLPSELYNSTFDDVKLAYRCYEKEMHFELCLERTVSLVTNEMEDRNAGPNKSTRYISKDIFPYRETLYISFLSRLLDLLDSNALKTYTRNRTSETGN